MIQWSGKYGHAWSGKVRANGWSKKESGFGYYSGKRANGWSGKRANVVSSVWLLHKPYAVKCTGGNGKPTLVRILYGTEGQINARVHRISDSTILYMITPSP